MGSDLTNAYHDTAAPIRLSSAIAIPLFAFHVILANALSASGTLVLSIASGVVLVAIGRRRAITVFRRFLPLLGFAVFFLTMIHAVNWSEPTITEDGLVRAGTYINRLFVIFAGISFLVVCVERDELYATLLFVRVPMPLIFGIFRASWILSRIPARASDVLIAQRMRGIRIKGPVSKIHAVGMSLHALFNSALLELEEVVFSLVNRGVFHKGTKTPMTPVRFTRYDAAYTAILTIVFAVALYYDGLQR